MSVIQRIRDKGAWIIFGIIALALVAFILQDGMGRGRGIFSNTTTVGKVNGVKIQKEDFDAKLELYGNGQDRSTLLPQMWQQEVDRIILHQEYDKLGLTVSDKELSDLLFSPNSPLAREFTNPETGVFDEAGARKAFATLQKSKNEEQKAAVMQGYIEPLIEQALSSKYQNLLRQSAYVPNWLVEKQTAENKTFASFSYVAVPYGVIPDSSITVSDDEIMAYVKKHPQGFERDAETRAFSYVSFDVSPTATDSSDITRSLNEEKDAFVGASDMTEFFIQHPSELSYYNSFLGQKQIQQPVKDSLFKLSAGQTYGPYLDGSNYVIAKMVAARTIPDSVKVRHILIATHQRDPQSGTFMRVKQDSAAKKLVDSIANFINAGAAWDSICKKYSEDPGSKDKGGVYDKVVSGGMVAPFNDFIFTGTVGQKGIVKTDFGYHYIEILSQKGTQPGYKIAYLAKPVKPSDNTVNDAFTAAQQFAGTSKDKKQFDENAAKLKKTVIPGGEVKESDFTAGPFGNQGRGREFVRWLYNNKTGTVSEPNDLGNKYVVAIITAVNEKGLANAAQARPQAEVFVRNEKKAKQIIETKFKGNTLEAYATSAGVPVLRADSVAFNVPFINGLGTEPKVVGAAFNKSLTGKVSQPIAGNSGVIAVKPEVLGQKELPAGMDANSIKTSLMNIATSASRGVFEALRKVADIKDYRFKLGY
jgi:peptidyl-prolyl cis-trans isomerase D